MLVAMKQTVLTRAAEARPQRRRRGRRAGIVIGVIAVLGLGATGGGVALGMIPQPFAAAPAPTAAPSRTPSAAPSTPAAAPVQETPEPAPTPTSTRRPFAIDDPSTWTISGNELGPIALGGQFDAETAVLHDGGRAASEHEPCPAMISGTWKLDGTDSVEVRADVDGVIRAVRLRPTVPSDDAPVLRPDSPRTAQGVTLGSTLTELRSVYPDIHPVDPGATAEWSFWETDGAAGPMTFGLALDGETVNLIDIGNESDIRVPDC